MAKSKLNLLSVLFFLGAFVPGFTHAALFPIDAVTITTDKGSGSSTGTAFSAPGSDRTIYAAYSYCSSSSTQGYLTLAGWGNLLYRNPLGPNANLMQLRWQSGNAITYDKTNSDTCTFTIVYSPTYPPAAESFTATVDTTDLETAVAATTAAVADLNSEFTLLWNFLQGVFVLFLVWMTYRFIEKYIIP